MKSFLLAALLALFSLNVRAQTYYLDLTGQVLDLPGRTVAVEQVLDNRDVHQAVGIVFRGLNGKPAAVAFRQGVETELTSFFAAQMPPQPTDHRLVLCLLTLHIGEIVGGIGKQATADFTADVYEKLPDGYHFVRQIGASASAQGRAVTSLHADHLVQLLGRGLGQVGAADLSAGAARPGRTLAELRAAVPTAVPVGARSPAVLREAPRRGLYQRFEQFAANRPDASLGFRLDTLRRRFQSPLAAARWLGVAWVRPVATGPDALPPDLWGFSDGRQLFVRYGKQFYALLRQGSFFTFVGEAPLDQNYQVAESQVRAQRTFMYGVVVGSLAHTRLPNHTAEPTAYGLDPRTGTLEPYPGLHMPLNPDTAYVYVYRMPLPPSAASPAVGVLVESREVGALRPGQYLEVPWARSGKPLRLCLTGLPLANSCLLVVPNVSQLNYLQIDAANPNQPWQWVPAAQGAADLDALDRQAGRPR